MKRAKVNKQVMFIILFSIVLIGIECLNAQSILKDSVKRDATEHKNTIVNETTIEDTMVMYILISDKYPATVYIAEPKYPGGDDARTKFLQENLVYPEEARKVGLEGRVVVEFIVEPNGSLSNFKIVRHVAPILDEEALRVVKLMPNWIPEKYQDKTVRVKYEIPIIFSLQ